MVHAHALCLGMIARVTSATASIVLTPSLPNGTFLLLWYSVYYDPSLCKCSRTTGSSVQSFRNRIELMERGLWEEWEKICPVKVY